MKTKNRQVYYQIQWRRPEHMTWRVDEDLNTSLFKTKQEAIDYINAGGFDTLETRIREIK